MKFQTCISLLGSVPFTIIQDPRFKVEFWNGSQKLRRWDVCVIFLFSFCI